MKPFHAIRSTLLAAGALLAAALPAYAQTKLTAQYTATLAGVPVGHGVWVAEISDDRYSAALNGGTSGLVRMFASGSGDGAVTGVINNGIFVPSNFESTIKSDKRADEVRFSLAGGNVKELVVEPPTPPNPDRIPITEAQLRGIADPLTAALVRIPGNGEMISELACSRGASVFTGRVRFDVLTAFKRIELVKAQKGYQGPAVVCAAYVKPVAGHIPDRGIMKHLSTQRDMEVYLVPIAGTRIMAPYRVTVPTSFGLGALSATQFITEPQVRLTPTSARGQ